MSFDPNAFSIADDINSLICYDLAEHHYSSAFKASKIGSVVEHKMPTTDYASFTIETKDGRTFSVEVREIKS